MVETAQKEIERNWPDHAGHRSGTRHARWSTAEGVVCACGDVLGWPDPDNHETLSQYTKRIAAEQVDVASAPGRIQGAFGSYSRPTTEPEEGVAVTGHDPGWARGETAHDDDPGPSEPEEGERPVVSGQEHTPEPGDYPEPEQPDPRVGPSTEVYPDGDLHQSTEDQETPDAEQEPPVDWGMPDPEPDEAESSVWDTVEPPEDEPEPEILDNAHVQAVVRAVDEIVSLTTPDEAQTESDLPPWSERFDDEPGTELATVSEIGRDAVPYAGTPIFPEVGDELDPLNGRLAPLDPTEPYTPQDVELKIVEILGQIEKSEIFLRQQVAREHQATHNHTLRYALAIARSDARAQDQRNAEATLATEAELREMNEAKALSKCLRDSQHNLRSQLSGFQSVARSLAVSLTNALDGRSKPGQDSLPPEPPRAPWER